MKENQATGGEWKQRVEMIPEMTIQDRQLNSYAQTFYLLY